jgi:hypothetical protein
MRSFGVTPKVIRLCRLRAIPILKLRMLAPYIPEP